MAITSGHEGRHPVSHTNTSSAAVVGERRRLAVLFACTVVVPLLFQSPGRAYLSLDLQGFAIAAGALVAGLALAGSLRSHRDYWFGRWNREGWLVCFALLVGASWLFATAPTASLQATLAWTQPVLLFLLAPLLVRTPGEARQTLVWAAIGGSLLGAHFVLRAAGGNPADATRPLLAPGELPPNVVAGLLVLPFFASLALTLETPTGSGAHRLGRFTAPVIALALVLTRSRGVWLGLAIGGCVCVGPQLWRSRNTPRARRWVAGVFVALALVLGAATWISLRSGAPTPIDTALTLQHPDRGSAGGRLRRWENALPMIAAHPLLGIGPGNWTEVYPRYRSGRAADVGGDPLPYNAYLGLAAEAGVPATLALLAFFAALVGARAGPATPAPTFSALKASLVALLVAGVFHDVLRNRLLLVSVFVVAGLVSALARRGRVLPRRFAIGTTLGLVGLLVVSLGAEARHLAASLYQGALVESVAFEGPGRRLAELPVSGPLEPLARWYFGALEGPDDELWALLASERSSRPESAALWIARREAALGECDDAAPWIARALESSDPPEAWLLRGRCALRAGDAPAALEACASGLAVNSKVAELHALCGDALRDAGRPGEALRAYEDAESLYHARLEQRFGFASLPEARTDVEELENVAAARRKLRRRFGLPRDHGDLRRVAADTPLLHKGLALRGDRLLFSSNLAGSFDLWDAPVAGTTASPPRLLTRDRRSPFRPRAHPDGERAFFVSDADGDYRYALYERNLVSGRERRLTPWLVGIEAEYELAPDGSFLLVKRESGPSQDLFVVETNEGTYRRITSDGAAKRDLEIAPDGSALAWVEGDHRIVVRSRHGDEEVTTFEDSGQVLRWPRFAPTGRRLVFTSEAPDGERRLRVADLATGRHRAIPIRPALWLEALWIDERVLVARERVRDEYLLAEIDLVSGEERRVGPRSGVVFPPIRIGPGSTLAYAYGGARAPVQLERLDLPTDLRHALVRVEDLSPDEIVLHETIESGSARAYVYDPPQPTSAKVPAILWLHGAHAEFSPRWHPYAQYFAQAGFVFAALNVSSEADAAPDSDEARTRELLAFRDLLAQRSDVDPDRIFAVGVSAGTRSIHRALARRPDAFAALVEYAPIPEPAWQRPRAGLPPALVFLTENDPGLDPADRIPDLEAQRREGDTRVEWTVLPDEGHDLRRPHNIRERLDRTLAFLGGVGGDARRRVARRRSDGALRVRPEEGPRSGAEGT